MMIISGKTGKPVKVLHLEDSDRDVELVSSIFERAGWTFEIHNAKDRKSFIELLKTRELDIVLADLNISGFDGFDAIKIVNEKFPGIPLILVTDSVGEETAVTALKSGAADFVLKGNLERLIPAVSRALEEKRAEQDRRNFYHSLQQSEERYRMLMENLPASVFRISCSSPPVIMHANLSAAFMHGFNSIDELLSVSLDSLYVRADDREVLFSDIINQKMIKNRIMQFKKISGECFWGSVSAMCHIDNGGNPNWIDCVIEDITDRINIEEKLSGYLMFFETLVDTISSPVFYKDIKGRYMGCNRSFAEVIIGLPREYIINKTVFDLSDSIPLELAEMLDSQDRALLQNSGIQEYEFRIKCADGVYRHFRFSKATYKGTTGEVAGIVGIMMDISAMTEKESELKRINEEFEVLLTSLPSIIIGVSTKDRITHWNKFAETVFGMKAEGVIGRRFYEIEIKWSWDIIYESIGECIIGEKSVRIDDLKFENSEGKIGVLGLTINPLKRGGDVLEGFLILGRDVTEQKILERQLLQTSKLEAIGQLAAGIAHEINTPLQYVGDNLKFINRSFVGLINMLDVYERTCANIDNRDKLAEIFSQSVELSKKIKLPFLLQEMPSALEQALEGVGRVSKIVQSMKAFSHPGSGAKSPVDINKAIENTVTVSRNEWKYDAELRLDLASDLPSVPCFESEFNQVMLNLIVNAADAIHEARENGLIESGLIKIKTINDSSHVVISVEDNGTGIPLNVRDKIFDPFFTTKEVGKGTGQGLPISHSIIVEKHGGLLYFESEVGKGTTFIIRLPADE